MIIYSEQPILDIIFCEKYQVISIWLESKDALEVVWVSQSVHCSESTDRDFTDVTLVSEETYGDEDDEGDRVIWW